MDDAIKKTMDDDIKQTILQQKQAIEGIAQMQDEIKSLIVAQHKVLERRIALIGQPRQVYGDSIPPDPITPMTTMVHPLEKTTSPASAASSFLEESPSPLAKRNTRNNGNPFKDHQKLREEEKKSKHKSRENEKKKEEQRIAGRMGRLGFRTWLREVLEAPTFDMTMGALIIFNFFLICVELEWKRFDIEFALGMRSDDNYWSIVGPVFAALEKIFNGIFMAELIVYFFVFRFEHCGKDRLRMLDNLAIVLSALDTFILSPLLDNGNTKALTLLRLIRIVRALRLLRFLRVLRFMGMLGALRVLVQTIGKSVSSLVWSMAVVGFVILASAMFIAQLTVEPMMDSNLDKPLREWLYRYYGGTARCAYTMFEATFSGKWATVYSDKLIFQVSPWFSIFWIFYTIIVNFAIIRVISALFLKQTLDVAAIDAERVAAARLKEREKIMDTLRAIFALGDQENDGVLHRWEFEEMMENDEVLAMFDTLELETNELFMLFTVLSEDDGVADQEEFLTGAMKLKTQVKTVDIVQLMHEQMVIKRYIGLLAQGLQQVDQALHPMNPWDPKSILDHKDPAEYRSACTSNSNKSH